MRIPTIVLTLLICGNTEEAKAQTETASAAEPKAELSSEEAWKQAQVQVPWSGTSGTGVAFGYDNGSWGGEWVQGIRVRIPIIRMFSVNVRGIAVNSSAGEEARWDLGGRLEAIGHGPVLLNLVRLYGGGGVQLFYPVSGVDDKKITWGGGGHFGFEFFMLESMSFYLEIGGQSGVGEGLGGGATVVAGLQIYPF
jgi:hypothetical protein